MIAPAVFLDLALNARTPIDRARRVEVLVLPDGRRAECSLTLPLEARREFVADFWGNVIRGEGRANE